MDRGALLVGVAAAVAVAAVELHPRRLVFDRRDRLSGPLIAATQAAVAAAAVVAYGRPSRPLELAGALAAAAGFGLRLAAARALRSDYCYAPRAPGSLCIRGPYRWCRHPAYLGTCLYALAPPLWFASPVAMALVPAALAAVVYRLRLEEAILSASIRGYVAYRRRTAALLPFLF
jgi:protein-S-isoprenylcysteine O-methyltransferase Ste14